MLVSFLVHFFTLGGILYTFGIFQRYYLANNVFPGATSLQISFIGSIGSAAMPGFGPISGRLADKYGYRLMVLIGSILVFLAMLLASFSTSLWQFMLTEGLMYGIGMSLWVWGLDYQKPFRLRLIQMRAQNLSAKHRLRPTVVFQKTWHGRRDGRLRRRAWRPCHVRSRASSSRTSGVSMDSSRARHPGLGCWLDVRSPFAYPGAAETSWTVDCMVSFQRLQLCDAIYFVVPRGIRCRSARPSALWLIIEPANGVFHPVFLHSQLCGRKWHDASARRFGSLLTQRCLGCWTNLPGPGGRYLPGTLQLFRFMSSKHSIGCLGCRFAVD